jgi:hypothetical protein
MKTPGGVLLYDKLPTSPAPAVAARFRGDVESPFLAIGAQSHDTNLSLSYALNQSALTVGSTSTKREIYGWVPGASIPCNPDIWLTGPSGVSVAFAVFEPVNLKTGVHDNVAKFRRA